jgi:glutamine synthetase
VRVFAEQSVLSARELEARYDVLAEQYATTINIEAATAAALARVLLLPAALRQRALIAEAAGPLTERLLAELDEPLADFYAALRALEAAPDDLVAAMAALREQADRLERLVAGDLWPLPKYADMLFVR